MVGRHSCSHFRSNSMDNNVLCQVVIKFKYLVTAAIYVTNSQFPNLVTSLQCQSNVKMPQTPTREAYRGRSWCCGEENAMATPIPVPPRVLLFPFLCNSSISLQSKRERKITLAKFLTALHAQFGSMHYIQNVQNHQDPLPKLFPHSK